MGTPRDSSAKVDSGQGAESFDCTHQVKHPHLPEGVGLLKDKRTHLLRKV